MTERIPEAEQPEPRFAHLVPEIWDELGRILRTGWVLRGVTNPETVREHTLALMRLAETFEGLSEDERDGLIDMLEVHDWPEAIHGDEVILTDDAEEEKSRRAAKSDREAAAMRDICTKLGEEGKEVLALWLRYEATADPAASFAKQLDKYQAVEQALAYEKAQGIPLFEEFAAYGRPRITHPLLAARMTALDREFAEYQGGRKVSPEA